MEEVRVGGLYISLDQCGVIGECGGQGLGAVPVPKEETEDRAVKSTEGSLEQEENTVHKCIISSEMKFSVFGEIISP